MFDMVQYGVRSLEHGSAETFCQLDAEVCDDDACVISGCGLCHATPLVSLLVGSVSAYGMLRVGTTTLYVACRIFTVGSL